MKLTTEHIIKLLAVRGVGRAKVFKLADLITFRPHDDAELADALTEQMVGLRVSPVAQQEILACFAHAGEQLAESQQKGIKTLSYFDEAFPALLKEITNPPIVLHVLGNLDSLLLPMVAVIGTQEPSEYGQRVGERIGYRLGERSIHVVS